MSVFVISKNIL